MPSITKITTNDDQPLLKARNGWKKSRYSIDYRNTTANRTFNAKPASCYKWVNPNLVKKQNVPIVRTPAEEKANEDRITAIALKMYKIKVKNLQEAALKAANLKETETEKSQSSNSASPQNTTSNQKP